MNNFEKQKKNFYEMLLQKEEFYGNIINEKYLEEVSNLRKRVTGLPMNLTLQIETDAIKKYKHNLPRIKFQNNTSDRITSNSDLIPVSIEDEPKVLIDKSYDASLFKATSDFIKRNKEILLKFWNQEIDEYELRDLLK